MILKAGTYRWNDVLPFISSSMLDINDMDFYFNFKSMSGENFNRVRVYYDDSNENDPELTLSYLNSEDDYIEVYHQVKYNEQLGTYWVVDNAQTFVIESDQELLTDEEEDVEYSNVLKTQFFTYFITATNYNEVNAKPLAEITYNGETIAQLNAGETATLSCKDKKMASDVVVKVNEVESKIPEGYVKPEGTLEITLNNIEAEFPIDCSQYAKVAVNTAEPLRISDPTVLDNITDSPWGVGGSVFLYEGATTDSYENGALYYLEDTEK